MFSIYIIGHSMYADITSSGGAVRAQRPAELRELCSQVGQQDAEQALLRSLWQRVHALRGATSALRSAVAATTAEDTMRAEAAAGTVAALSLPA